MKFLHTADWHIGKSLQDISLLPLQAEGLRQIIDLAIHHQVDAIVVAGDIFDRSQPSKEALALVDHTIKEIVGLKIPLIMIAGNHDSNQLIHFHHYLGAREQFYSVGLVDDKIEAISIKEAIFYPFPYLHPATVKEKSFVDLYDHMLKDVKLDPHKKNILIAHGFVVNQGYRPEESDSERLLSVGNLDAIEASALMDFDYVALGHLHRRQWVLDPKISYSGSLYKYSKSEVNHPIGVNLVEWEDNGSLAIHFCPLTYSKDLCLVKDSLNQLLASPSREDFLYVDLTDKKMQLGAFDRLQQKFPNLLGVTYSQLEKKSKNSDVLDVRLDLNDLFDRYYQRVTGQKLSEDQKDIVDQIFMEEEQSETHTLRD